MGLLLIMTIVRQENPWTLKDISSELSSPVKFTTIEIFLLGEQINFSFMSLIWIASFLLIFLMAYNVSNRWILSLLICAFSIFLMINKWVSILAFLFGLLSWVVLQSWRGVYKFARIHRFVFRLFACSIFLITLIPTPRSWQIVLSFVFGFFAIFSILFAIQPVLHFFEPIINWLERILFNTQTWVFLCMIGIFVFLSYNLGAYFLFDHLPHVTDSIVQIFHGKIFALGRLVAPVPPLRDFFDFNPLMIWRTDRWYSVFPPGHSLLMMLGVLINSPWIINPSLGTFSVILIYFLGVEIYDQRTGRLASLFGAFSPFLFVMSSGFMNHGSGLFYTTIFLLFFARTVKYQRLWAAVFSGVSLGLLINVRPYTALAIALPFIVYSVILLVGNFRRYFLQLLLLATTTLFFIGLLFTYNNLTNGSPTLFGYVAQFGKSHNPGFNPKTDGKTAHTPKKGLRTTLKDLNFLNLRLAGWPIPPLLFVCLLFCSGYQNYWDYLLISLFFSLVLAHFFYWYDVGDSLSPRFLYESCSALLILVARGVICLPYLLPKSLKMESVKRQLKLSTSITLLLCVVFMVTCRISTIITYYASDHFYPHIQPALLKTIKRYRLQDAIVFVEPYFYRSVFSANEPLLDGHVIYAQDQQLSAQKLSEWETHFPNRTFFRLRGETLEVIKEKVIEVK